MEAFLDRIANPVIAFPLAILVAYSLYSRLTTIPSVPSQLPWVGRDITKAFSGVKATLGSLKHGHRWLSEGYTKYSKNGKSYIIPDFSGKPQVILPRSQVPWMLDQPDNVLSTSSFHYDVLEGSYAFTHPHLLQNPYHEHVVHKYLPRRVAAMVPSMWEEIARMFDRTWGMNSDQWTDICVFDNMISIIPCAVSRMFVGLPLCRNEDYLSNIKSFTTDVVNASMLYLSFTPQWLKPLIGPLVTIPNNRHYRGTARHTLPLIEERLANFKRETVDPDFIWEEPNDYLSWHIDLAMSEHRLDELTPDIISRRLMPLNFAAIHTTTITITNCLFDLISSDPSKGYLEGIREEAERVWEEDGGQFTKAGLGRCHRADSAIRESMRVSNFMSRGVMRKVLPSKGIENKFEGWTAPQNAYIGLDVHSAQHDPEVYPDPDTYDAFRFSRSNEREDVKTAAGDDENGATLKAKNTGLVTTSDIFLPFGHGRHACPGRFFVALELKMILAYMVMNYEVEPLPIRPPSKVFGQNKLPPTKAKIRVRRRKNTSIHLKP